MITVFNPLAAQETEKIYNLDEEIVVTASQIPTAFENVARSVIVFDRDEIESIPARSVQDLLEYASGVDVQQRGPNGVQADVSIRGATFEQTLVLIDGVKLSDPQTGHHNMNLPLTLADIEKIEILKGQGSKLYGPNAFGGVINIITKKAQQLKLDAMLISGEHAYREGQLSFHVPVGSGGHRLSLSSSRSDGYRPNTDFDIRSASYGSYFNIAGQQLDVSLGYSDKKFAANSFYHPVYLNQWERTKTSYAKTGINLETKYLKIKPYVFWRRHNDEYKLDRDHPEWYHNRHETDVTGGGIQSSLVSAWGVSAVGGEYIAEDIVSNNLGNHRRSKGGIFLEHQLTFNKWHAVLGTSIYNYSDWGWRSWPGLDVGYQLNDASRVFASVGQAFRIPTFTELYYSDRANRGNSSLKAEKAWNYELGYQYRQTALAAGFSLFRRDSENLIDWVWQTPDSIWQAQNFTEVVTSGIELDLRLSPQILEKSMGINSIQFSYSYIKSDKDTDGFDSKYVLNHLRHQALFAVRHRLFSKSFTVNWKLRYQDRLQYDAHFFVDAYASYQLSSFKLFLEAGNLFDRSYEEYLSIPQPGRWLKLGLNYQLTGNK